MTSQFLRTEENTARDREFSIAPAIHRPVKQAMVCYTLHSAEQYFPIQVFKCQISIDKVWILSHSANYQAVHEVINGVLEKNEKNAMHF